MGEFGFPIPECEVQGNKTLLKNFKELYIALRRDPRHLSRFLSKNLATHGKIHGNVLQLQGKFPVQRIQLEIEDYIKDFVCCKECFKRTGKCRPDTNLLSEGKLTFLECEVCGAKYLAPTV